MSSILNQEIELFRLSKSIFDVCSVIDIFSCVIEFLSFKDVVNLFSNKISNQMTKALIKFNVKVIQGFIIRSQFDIFMKKFNLYPSKLMSLLGRVDAVIAGGFALSLFTGELYDASDINIYIPSESYLDFKRKLKYSNLEKYLLKKGFIKNRTNLSCLDENKEKTHEEFENKDIKRKVQIILHHYNNDFEPFNCVGHSVINNFDFTVAKCYIKKCWKDFERIQFNCLHLHDVTNKIIELNTNRPQLHFPKKFVIKCFKRFRKYESRGFGLSNDMNFLIPKITDNFCRYKLLVDNYIIDINGNYLSFKDLYCFNEFEIEIHKKYIHDGNPLDFDI